MDFITIDFETATSARNSPCELGLTFVKNLEIVETKSWLIKPRSRTFDYFNTMIHGITANHVALAPEFDHLWREIHPLIENQFLIAHNAGFDISVLRSTLDAYSLPYPTLDYSCSYIFSKKVWEGLSAYDLKSLCKLNGIALDHHRAGPDSRATAELALKAFEQSNVCCAEDFTTRLQTTIGRLYDGGYKPSETQRNYKSKEITKIVGDPQKHNPNSIFYGRTVVFTGTLSSMVRTTAQQLIADVGGIIGGTVTSATDFLIVGQQDYRIVGDDNMSNKQEKAVKLILKGSFMEVISEDHFLRSL